MLVLPDANILISSLLSRDSSSAPARVVEAALTGQIDLLLPPPVIEELTTRIPGKPYLAERIPSRAVANLVGALTAIAVTAPTLVSPYPPVSSDPDDDYLFEYALTGGADYLVSGDRGVLAIERIGDLRIVSPAGFIGILRDAGLLPE